MLLPALFHDTADTKGDRVDVKTEQDVFRVVGHEWKEPHEREMGK